MNDTETDLNKNLNQKIEQFKHIVEEAALAFSKNTGLIVTNINLYKMDLLCGYEYTAKIDLSS